MNKFVAKRSILCIMLALMLAVVCFTGREAFFAKAAENDTPAEFVGEDGEQPGEDGEQPGEDGEQPGEDGEDPGEDGEQPGEDGEQPGEDGEQPGEDGEDPGEDGEQPGEDGEQPGEDGEDPGEDGEEPVETLTPEDFADELNRAVSTQGFLDTYGAISDFASQQPFPNDWGMKVSEIREGVFTRTSNDGTPYINDAFTASYLPTNKDVSKVNNYYVEATAKPTERSNWGGVGIVIGRAPSGDIPGAPVLLWVSEGGNVTVTHSLNEWAASAGTSEPIALDTEMKIAAVVQNKVVTAYVNGEKIGEVDLSDVEFEPNLGLAFKNWNAEFSGVTFKTTDTVEDITYTVYQISGGVEIGTVEYIYGEEIVLDPVERKGNTFMGWHLLPDLSDGVIDKLPAGTGGDVYVYCEYVVTSYTIKYYDGETELENAALVKSYNYRDYIELEAVTKDGYTFDGWYAAADFSGDKIECIAMGSTGDKVFYAKYTREEIEEDSNDRKIGLIIGLSVGGFVLVAAGVAVGIVLHKKKAGK